MSRSRFRYKKLNLYLHGLVFETSIWQLAGSTRLGHRENWRSNRLKRQILLLTAYVQYHIMAVIPCEKTPNSFIKLGHCCFSIKMLSVLINSCCLLKLGSVHWNSVLLLESPVLIKFMRGEPQQEHKPKLKAQLTEVRCIWVILRRNKPFRQVPTRASRKSLY